MALNAFSMESALSLFLNYGTTLKCHFYEFMELRGNGMVAMFHKHDKHVS